MCGVLTILLTLQVSKSITKIFIGPNFIICKSDEYAVFTSLSITTSCSGSCGSISFLNTATILVVTKNTHPQKYRKPASVTNPKRITKVFKKPSQCLLGRNYRK